MLLQRAAGDGVDVGGPVRFPDLPPWSEAASGNGAWATSGTQKCSATLSHTLHRVKSMLFTTVYAGVVSKSVRVLTTQYMVSKMSYTFYARKIVNTVGSAFHTQATSELPERLPGVLSARAYRRSADPTASRTRRRRS